MDSDVEKATRPDRREAEYLKIGDLSSTLAADATARRLNSASPAKPSEPSEHESTPGDVMKVVIDANWKLYSNTVPKNFEAVGTITDDGDSGALVVINNGLIPMYWQLNAGVLKGLPQHEVKAAVELAKFAKVREKDFRSTDWLAALGPDVEIRHHDGIWSKYPIESMGQEHNALRKSGFLFRAKPMDVLPTALELAAAKPSESSSERCDSTSRLG